MNENPYESPVRAELAERRAFPWYLHVVIIALVALVIFAALAFPSPMVWLLAGVVLVVLVPIELIFVLVHLAIDLRR